MALIKCSNCENQISDRAKVCPHCGQPVVLEVVEAEEKTQSGIILTGTAKEKPQEAEVIAVGPGAVVDGKEIKMEVKVGEKVICSKYAGTEVSVEGKDYLIMKQSDIIAIL